MLLLQGCENLSCRPDIGGSISGLDEIVNDFMTDDIDWSQSAIPFLLNNTEIITGIQCKFD